MAENKKSFIAYADWITVIKKLVLRDRENGTNYGGELFLHILEYVNDNEPIPIDFIIEMAFEPIKLQLKRDLEKWDTERGKRSEAGRKGGLARASNAKQRQAVLEIVKPAIANQADNVNVTVNDNVNDTKEVYISKIQEKFYQSLIKFVNDFDKKDVKAFYDYWSEPNKSKTKIKYQLEKTWDTKRRLQRWTKNKFNGKTKQDTKTWEAPKGDGGFKIHRS